MDTALQHNSANGGGDAGARGTPARARLIALTRDPALMEALDYAEADGRLAFAGDEAKLATLLMAGDAGIVVFDAGACSSPVAELAERLRAQLPDVVLIAAGRSSDQSELAGLVAAGTVYRFLHKPVSNQRVKLFVDAAWRRFEDGATGTHSTVAEADDPAPPGPLVPVLAGAAIVVLVAIGTWLAVRPAHRPSALQATGITRSPGAASAPAAAATPATSTSTAAAPAAATAPAAAAGLHPATSSPATSASTARSASTVASPSTAASPSTVAPPSAATSPSTVAPPSTAASPPAVAPGTRIDQLATAAEQALLDGNLAEAERLANDARKVDPASERIKLLQEQIQHEQQQRKTEAALAQEAAQSQQAARSARADAERARAAQAAAQAEVVREEQARRRAAAHQAPVVQAPAVQPGPAVQAPAMQAPAVQPGPAVQAQSAQAPGTLTGTAIVSAGERPAAAPQSEPRAATPAGSG
ncbi:MAG TPA: hypothetical protein VMB48_03710, partial [Steroidobacteraceae bacterium]|nr:hypothetical protein [Steroidobacteraceae bacterium]